MGSIAGLDDTGKRKILASAGVPTSERLALSQVTIPTELCPIETEMLKQREDSLSRPLNAKL